MSWIGVDLDGTLAFYDNVWRGPEHIGEPIPAMVERVKAWLAEGKDVRIFTARIAPAPERPLWRPAEVEEIREPIERWCLQHLGQVLPVTCMKDYGMTALWDDRCVQVVPNHGVPIAEAVRLTCDPAYRASRAIAES